MENMMEKGRLIGQGRTSEVYDWDDENIVKLYRKGMPFADVLNEFNISNCVYGNGLLTPFAKEIVEVEERKGIVFERIRGITMMHYFISKPWYLAREAHRLADLHYDMHKVKVSGLMKQKQKLLHNINATKKLSEAKKNIIIDYLNGLDEENSLCHGDFHPDNILILKDKYVIIDWMTGSMGNAASDVARTCILLTTGALPPGNSILKKNVIEFVRNKFYSEYIKQYLKISGILMEDIEKWILPVAAARLWEGLSENEAMKLLKIIDERIGMIR
jgi:hypothetical protein